MTCASALGFLKGVVFAKVLGAPEFGYYGLVVVVLQSGIYLSSVGFLSALNNQLPVALGRAGGDTRELIDRSLGALLLASAATSTLFLVVVAFAASGDTRTALALAALVTFATVVSEFFVLLLRVERRLVPLSSAYLTRALLAIGLGAGAGAAWGFEGVVASEIAALALVVAISRRVWLRTVRVRRPTLSGVRWLLRWGAPLMVANTLVGATFTVDRIFVASSLPDDFGQYAFASLVVIGWLAVGGMVNQAVAPQLLFDYGSGMSLEAVWRRSARVVAISAAGGLAGLVVLLVAMEPLKRGVFSEYAVGLDVMPILYLGGLASLLSFPGFILHALRPAYSTVAAAAGAGVAVLGGAVLAAGDPALRDFAWLFAGSQAVTMIVAIAGAAMTTRRPPATR